MTERKLPDETVDGAIEVLTMMEHDYSDCIGESHAAELALVTRVLRKLGLACARASGSLQACRPIRASDEAVIRELAALVPGVGEDIAGVHPSIMADDQAALDAEDVNLLLRKVVLADEELRANTEAYERAKMELRRARRHVREAVLRRTVAANAARRYLDRREAAADVVTVDTIERDKAAMRVIYGGPDPQANVT